MVRMLGHRGMSLVIAAMSFLPGMAQAGAICGPGAHWVDGCAGGSYDFYSTTIAAVNLDLDRNGSLETNIPFIQFNGLTSVFLGVGQNAAPPHSMQTELYRLVETDTTFGATLRAGDGIGNLISNGPLYSPGHIDEQGNPLYADSFFDVFFELTIPDGPLPLVLTNNLPLQVTCTGLPSAPPNQCSYTIVSQSLSLYENGVARGQLLLEPGLSHHTVTPTPEPGSMVLLGIALCGIGLLRWRRA